MTLQTSNPTASADIAVSGDRRAAATTVAAKEHEYVGVMKFLSVIQLYRRHCGSERSTYSASSQGKKCGRAYDIVGSTQRFVTGEVGIDLFPHQSIVT
jgi:hypothetical protein